MKAPVVAAALRGATDEEGSELLSFCAELCWPGLLASSAGAARAVGEDITVRTLTLLPML